MDQEENWLCVIDLKNDQEDYAKATHLIEILKGLESDRKTDAAEGTLLFPFRIMRSPKKGLEVQGQVQKLEEMAQVNDFDKIREIKTWEQLDAGLKKSGKTNRFLFFLRVEMGDSDTDLTNLRYMLLLLQITALPTKKIAILLKDTPSNTRSPNSLYFKTSQFLRFIQKRYHCLYGVYEAKAQPLSVRSSGTQQTFLPLLEIDEQTYFSLKRFWNLKNNYRAESYEDLHTILLPSGGKRDQETVELFQIGARLLFRGLNGRVFGKKEKKQELLQLLEELVSGAGGITALDMLLFGTLMSNDMHDGFELEQAQVFLRDVQILAGAVVQILENIVNHSEHHKGVFTMRLQTEENYIRKNYPGYPIGEEEYGLELLIADGNQLDNIIDHFIDSRKATSELKRERNALPLSDFFQEKPESRFLKLWETARRERPGMCHGLLTFAQAVGRFGGTFYVRSSAAFTGTDAQSFFYSWDGRGNEPSDGDRPKWWMPGTQFSVIFKRTAFHRYLMRKETLEAHQGSDDPVKVLGSVFDNEHIIYATTYQDLAFAMTLEGKIESLFEEDCVGTLSKELARAHMTLSGQDRKDRLTESWRSFFSGREEDIGRGRDGKYIMLFTDLGDAAFAGETDEVQEAFCKGFFASRFFQDTGKNTHYIIILNNMPERLGRIMYQSLGTIAGRIDISRTGVYFYQCGSEAPDQAAGRLPYFATSLQETLQQLGRLQPSEAGGFPKIFPYLLFPKGDDKIPFENQMSQQAMHPISERDAQGYMIEDTHMRLGNKVHLDSFFEMSLFFENPNYAYYTAFLLLRRLEKMPAFRSAKKLLFYGYTSYSRGIVWAALQILREYLTLKKCPILESEFVIYQNDLKLESDRPSVQMYYSREEWQKDPTQIWESDEMILVQIVPISSSLTTFNKMLAELHRSTKKKIKPMANITAFWVRDDYLEKWEDTYKRLGLAREEAENSTEMEKAMHPTRDEEYFWDCVDPYEKKIASKRLDVDVEYLSAVRSCWRNPLQCEKCFPEDPLLEFPLVETDATSTIPTQQYYLERSGGSQDGATKQDAWEAKNDERVSHIRGNLLYGHISRGHNHFQYYISTRRYFLRERENVKAWLCDLSDEVRRQAVKKERRRYIDVLVVPKQTSNVEFSQYVYEYCFRSEAECIIVNTEKEFRSNFLAEYNGLSQRLFGEIKRGKALRFHYVDTAVDSGVTFRRASDLIQSLFDKLQPIGQYGVEREKIFSGFNNVFLLISRISYSSKRSFVQDPTTEFHAYVELHISNMRTFGDSCVPCKLQKETWKYFQNAATKSVSARWQEKALRYRSYPFDSPELRDKPMEDGYRRMACTHRASYYFNRARGGSVGDYFQALQDYFTELQKAAKGEQSSPVYQGLAEKGEPAYLWYSAALKIMVRPFFSFDYKLRCAVMDLYLLLAEQLLSPECAPAEGRLIGKKGHLTQARLDWIKGLASDIEQSTEELYKVKGARSASAKYMYLRFVQDNLLKGLTDLKSNFILRRDTICAIFKQAAAEDVTDEERETLFEHYLRSILRLIHNSSDESKSLWLEYLLCNGEEYPKEGDGPVDGAAGRLGIERLKKCIPPEAHKCFQNFTELLCVENNRTLFQGVQNLYYEDGQNWKRQLEEYNMRNVRSFINFSRKAATGQEPDDQKEVDAALDELKPLVRLYDLLRGKKEEEGKALSEKAHTLKRYDSLQEALQHIISGENVPQRIANKVLLFGTQKPSRQKQNEVSYYMISPQVPFNYDEQQPYDDALDELRTRMQSQMPQLEKNGFCLLERAEQQEIYDAVLLLDNNYQELDESLREEDHIQRIEPVYIFLPCGTNWMGTLLLLREIQMFRCKLIAWLEEDFNNNAIADMVQQRHWAELLANDKVGHHAGEGFMDCVRRVLSEDQAPLDGMGYVAGADGHTEKRQKEDRYKLLKANDGCNGPIERRLRVLSREEQNKLMHWYLLCSYINSCIARIYRTYVQEESHSVFQFSETERLKQMRETFARDCRSTSRVPAYSLNDMFFTPLESGSSRKGYLEQILQVVTFIVDGKPDTTDGEDMEMRMKYLKEKWEGYDFVQFPKEEAYYAYRAEYLAAIILDCCISALKVGQLWNDYDSGYDAFLALLRENDPKNRCQIWLKRRHGEGDFDYLVISNEIFNGKTQAKKNGPGMSQHAMRWYINKFWQFIHGETGAPEVKILSPGVEDKQYRVMLPILKKEDGSEHEETDFYCR